MLRAIIISPDVELGERLDTALKEIENVTVTRMLNRYPNALELVCLLRAHAQEVIFVSAESTGHVLELARELEKNTPGVQLVATSRFCDPQMLLELMRAGIREFAPFPLDPQLLKEILQRVQEAVDARPPTVETTDHIFSFLPAKPGVGTSTIAVNTAKALSMLPETSTLLCDLDLNSGMTRFMLKLQNPYGVPDAAEHSLGMDDSMWPSMITRLDHLDVLHAGQLNLELRVSGNQLWQLLDFMRRKYRALCFDLSGNLEKYSIDVMSASRLVFLVCTPEISALHLAREKYLYLSHLDLGDRIRVLLNRCDKKSLVSAREVERKLGLPVHRSFPNDYEGVQQALIDGGCVPAQREFSKQAARLAQSMMGEKESTEVAAAGLRHRIAARLGAATARLRHAWQGAPVLSP